MDHNQVRQLVDQRREEAKQVASKIPDLSVTEWADVHLLSDGSAYVECQLLVRGPNA